MENENQQPQQQQQPQGVTATPTAPLPIAPIEPPSVEINERLEQLMLMQRQAQEGHA